MNSAPEPSRQSPLHARWGDALEGGFVVIPNVLLLHQQELALDCEEMVVLANLLSHWREREPLPFPRTESLARWCGISRRTVQRRLKQLEEKGFLSRTLLPRRSHQRAIAHYDLDGTVEKLKVLGVRTRETRILGYIGQGATATKEASKHYR